jgi:hypothetical protein
MTFTSEHESFIQDALEALEESRLAIFAGAGLSVGAGYVDWKELLKDVASDINLDINKEDDLISLAQYHFNEFGGRSKLNKKILKSFTTEVEETENHRILSRLPIDTYWTTNYDKLIESTIEKMNKIVDVKHEKKQLPNSRSKRDAVVYKMHGDVDHAHDAIITRDDYEQYFKTHEPFVNTLQGDLITKLFIFIGFSFNDPNLEYALSRVRLSFGKDSSHHYCFIKEVSESEFKSAAEYDYHRTRQRLRINDLRKYQINPVVVSEYTEITVILAEIERRYKLKSIFISGSAEEYGDWGRERAVKLIHKLSGKLVSKDYRIVNGFGWGVGSAVINGALEQIYSNPKRYSESQLIVKPFPQFASGDKALPELWDDYRKRMISLTGLAIFIFGNKYDTDGTSIINAGGVKKEFDIAIDQGCLPIPIASTGYMALELWNYVMEKFIDLYGSNPQIKTELESLEHEMQAEKVIATVIRVVDLINT